MDNPILIHAEQIDGPACGDRSLERKGAAWYETIQKHQSLNIRLISENRAEQVSYYRFLNNENVTVSELVKSLGDHCQQQVAGLHILAISDTSEINERVSCRSKETRGTRGSRQQQRPGLLHTSNPGTGCRKWFSLGFEHSTTMGSRSRPCRSA